jgi:hypothetical protein
MLHIDSFTVQKPREFLRTDEAKLKVAQGTCQFVDLRLHLVRQRRKFLLIFLVLAFLQLLKCAVAEYLPVDFRFDQLHPQHFCLSILMIGVVKGKYSGHLVDEVQLEIKGCLSRAHFAVVELIQRTDVLFLQEFSEGKTANVFQPSQLSLQGLGLLIVVFFVVSRLNPEEGNNAGMLAETSERDPKDSPILDDPMQIFVGLELVANALDDLQLQHVHAVG